MSRAYFSSGNTDFTHSQSQQSRPGSDDHCISPIDPIGSNSSIIPSYENAVTQARLTTPLSINAPPSPLSSHNAQRKNSINSKSANLKNALLRETSTDWTQAKRALEGLVSLKRFLLAAPLQFVDSDIIRQFRLPNDEQVSCVRWDQVFCITGTDIVRCILHRFAVFGRDVTNRKKFEEGIFSDLRNLKINVDAILESPKSELLEFLYKKNCVRTKKKQKVFFWYSVHHEQLFLDALERELKKESAYHGIKKISGVRSQSEDDLGSSQASTVAVREPALSFKYDSSIPLAEQIPRILRDMPEPLAAIVDESTSSRVPDSTSLSDESSDGPLLGDVDSMTRGLETPTNGQGDLYLRGFNSQREIYPLTPLQSVDSEVPGLNEHYSSHQLDHNGSHYALEKPFGGTEIIDHNYKLSAGQITSWPPHNALGMARNYGGDNLYANLTQQTHIPSLARVLFSGYSATEQHPGHEQLLNQAEWPVPQDFHVDQPAESDWATSSENTDFPLDVLNTRDGFLEQSLSASLFEAEFTDFAHHNRPALLSETSEYTEVTEESEAQTSLLGSPLKTSGGYSKTSMMAPGRPSLIPPSSLSLHSSMWNQSLVPETFEGSHTATKPASRVSNWTGGLPPFRFPDKPHSSGGPRGGVHKGFSLPSHPPVHGRYRCAS